MPEFGNATVLDRPLEYDRQEEMSVKPGLIQPESGTHKVVWWDPSKLELNIEGGLGLRQKEILADDGGASLAAYRAWQSARGAVLEQASKPEFQIFVPSQTLETPPGDVITVTAEFVSKPEGRPGGRRFGTLVHAILRDVELDASREAIAKLATLGARSIGAPVEEREAAILAVEAALAHPVLARARAVALEKGRRHREYPITLKLDDGRLLEGVIDLAFVENGAWTIVDFKTDADASERRAQYERQLQWYGYVLGRLTGMPAQGFLLGV
jgi:ATP-dependent helicase/nuclease subunit A